MSGICPYCDAPVAARSLDHIFPEFLGGRRKIVACAKCNNTFGHTFEAAAATDTLLPLHVSISSWGLPLQKRERAWRRAFEYRGMKFDLSVAEEDVKLRLSGPVSQKDKDGRPVAVIYADLEEAQRVARRVEKKKGKRPLIDKTTVEIASFHVPFNFLIDSNLERTALKMCTALSTLLPGFSPGELGVARQVLWRGKQRAEGVMVAFKSYTSLEAQRPPLAHVIYVERHQGCLQGVVQFFGVIQLYCHLGAAAASAPEAAMLGTLDPVTGEENISTVPTLGLTAPPDPYRLPKLFSKGTSVWLMKFEESAKQRGATKPVNLVGEVHVGACEPARPDMR